MPTIQTCIVKSRKNKNQTSNQFRTKLRYSGEIKLRTQMYQRKEEKKTKILKKEYIIISKISKTMKGLKEKLHTGKEEKSEEIRKKGSNGVFLSVLHGLKNTAIKLILILYSGTM